MINFGNRLIHSLSIQKPQFLNFYVTFITLYIKYSGKSYENHFLKKAFLTILLYLQLSDFKLELITGY